MSELKGFIEATKIEPKLEDITITPSKHEQNFKSKVDGYDKIRVNAIPCETLNVTPKKEKQVIEGMYDKVNVDGISAEILNITPKKESQYFDGIYEKIYVDEIERDNLTITPSMTEQSFNGLYENVVVKKITGDTLNITPTEEQQAFNGLYETVNVEAVDSEEVTIDPDFSTQDTVEVTATEGKYITKATVNKDTELVPENILEGTNIYGVDGTFKPLDTSDATATAGDIAKDKTAYVNGEKVTGTLEVGNHNATIDGTKGTVLKNMITSISNLDCRNVVYFTDFFYEFKNLTSISLINTESAKTLNRMFGSTTKLKTPPFFNTGNVTDFAGMFALSGIETIPFYDTSSGTAFGSMFMNCENIVSVPEFNTSNATNLYGMFSGCKKLISVPVFNTSKVTGNGMQTMFASCQNLSNESLNNILQTCINATSITNATYKTLNYIGLTSAQATTCTGLSNYQAFLDAGWTTGY